MRCFSHRYDIIIVSILIHLIEYYFFKVVMTSYIICTLVERFCPLPIRCIIQHRMPNLFLWRIDYDRKMYFLHIESLTHMPVYSSTGSRIKKYSGGLNVRRFMIGMVFD